MPRKMRGNRDAAEGTITADLALDSQRIRDHASGTGDADLQQAYL
jgi:hypothetical protein